MLKQGIREGSMWKSKTIPPPWQKTATKTSKGARDHCQAEHFKDTPRFSNQSSAMNSALDYSLYQWDHRLVIQQLTLAPPTENQAFFCTGACGRQLLPKPQYPCRCGIWNSEISEAESNMPVIWDWIWQRLVELVVVIVWSEGTHLGEISLKDVSICWPQLVIM